jgi:triosephosphate isomerase
MSGKIFAANWKLHKNPVQTKAFFETLFSSLLQNSKKLSQHQFVVFPPATSLESTSSCFQSFFSQVAAKAFAGRLHFGSQNTYPAAQGAYTGEVSSQVVKDLGGTVVLLGHSERRKIFGEGDELISQKVEFVQSLNLTAMLCIGETLEERQSGKTAQILEDQIRLGLAKVIALATDINAKENLIIAYEPVWAIGTGQVATTEQVEEAHRGIKILLNQLGLPKIKVLYGGSVKPDNSKSLLALPSVDGFLIGGAALEVDSYLKIAGLE